MRYYQCDKYPIEFVLSENIDKHFGSHNHVGHYVISVVMQGTVAVCLENREVVCHRGDVFIIPPYAMHSVCQGRDARLLSMCTQTTWSGCRGNWSRYSLESPPPAAHISYKPEMVGTQYGWVEIISPEKRWSQAWNHCYVLTRCVGCGSVQWQCIENLTSGKSKGCQRCSKPRQIPRWLDRRLTAAKQRCDSSVFISFASVGRHFTKNMALQSEKPGR